MSGTVIEIVRHEGRETRRWGAPFMSIRWW